MGLSGSLAHDRFDGRFNASNGKPHVSNLVQAKGYSKRGRRAEARYVHDFAIVAFDERIAYLKSRGAERCAPGDLAKAEQLLVRVKREWVSNLYGDALIDIERLEIRLDEVDNRVFHGKCQPGSRVITHRSIDNDIITKSVVSKPNNKPLSLTPLDQPIPSKLKTVKGTR